MEETSLSGSVDSIWRSLSEPGALTHRRVHLSEDVLYHALGDEIVLVNLRTQQYHTLDPVGSRIWNLLVKNSDLAWVLGTIEKEFDAEADMIRSDFVRFITELISLSLLISAD